jgi:hypothetical protein
MKTRCHFTYISLLLVLFVSGLSSVRAAEPAETVMLVATPKLGGATVAPSWLRNGLLRKAILV